MYEFKCTDLEADSIGNINAKVGTGTRAINGLQLNNTSIIQYGKLFNYDKTSVSISIFIHIKESLGQGKPLYISRFVNELENFNIFLRKGRVSASAISAGKQIFNLRGDVEPLSTVLPLGWNHIVVIYDSYNKTVSIVQNGKLMKQVGGVPLEQSPLFNKSLFIDGGMEAPDNSGNVTINSIKIINSVLSEADIAKEYAKLPK
jgi:hypothetical protein